MSFLRRGWQGMTGRAGAPSPWMQQYAAGLLGSQAVGPLERMGERLIGGLLMGGQQRAQQRQREEAEAKMLGIFRPPEGAGTLLSGRPVLPIVQEAAGAAPLPDDKRGILARDPVRYELVDRTPISDGEFMPEFTPEMKEMATKVEQGLPGLTPTQREMGRIATELIYSGDQAAAAIGGKLLDAATNVGSGDEVITGPDGSIYAWDGKNSKTMRKLFGKEKPNFKTHFEKDGIYQEDLTTGTITKIKSIDPERELDVRTESVFEMRDGVQWERKDRVAVDKETGEEVWRDTGQFGFAGQQTQEGPFGQEDAPYRRALNTAYYNTQDSLEMQLNIREQLNDQEWGQTLIDSFTLPGRLKQGWRTFKSWMGGLDEGTPEWEAANRIAAFHSDVAEAANLYIKNITGAQMSEAEASRLMKAIATINDDPASFQGKLDATIRRFERVQQAYLERLKETGDYESAERAALAMKKRILRDIEDEAGVADEFGAG